MWFPSSYWDSSYDDDVMEHRVGLNLLYAQVRVGVAQPTEEGHCTSATAVRDLGWPWAQLLSSLFFLVDGVGHRAWMDPCQQGTAPAAEVPAGKSVQEGGRGQLNAVVGAVPALDWHCSRVNVWC